MLKLARKGKKMCVVPRVESILGHPSLVVTLESYIICDLCCCVRD